MEVPSTTRPVTFVGDGSFVSNTFLEPLENGLMVRYTVRVSHQRRGARGQGVAYVIYDDFAFDTKEEVFHYGKLISERDESRSSKLTPWVDGPVGIITPAFVGHRAISVFIMGKGLALKGLAVPDIENLPPHELKRDEVEGIFDQLKKKELVEKFMPEKFVVGIARPGELIEAGSKNVKL